MAIVACDGAQPMNQIDLTNRVAVVTGGARGIGYSVAERMLRSGAAVSLWDVDAAGLKTAEERLASLGTVSSIQLDLTQEEAVADAVQRIVEQYGRLEMLINNAGITG